eukprot:6097638-Prymnesium_polylepis.1
MATEGFGPTILAPYAHVLINGNGGQQTTFVDGTIVAKSVSSSGAAGGLVVLHGEGYTGPIPCSQVPPSPPLPPAPPFVPPP